MNYFAAIFCFWNSSPGRMTQPRPAGFKSTGKVNGISDSVVQLW